MSCEAEQERVDQLSDQRASKAASCSSLALTYGYDSQEYQGCQGELRDLEGDLSEAQNALAQCQLENPPEATTRLLQTKGFVTFLRVNEPGSGFGGGSTNWFDADVIFMLDNRTDKAFGFQLRDDPTAPVRQGMLALLRQAVLQGLQVTTDYIELVALPNNNSFVIRVALENIPQPSPRGLGGLNTIFR